MPWCGAAQPRAKHRKEERKGPAPVAGACSGLGLFLAAYILCTPADLSLPCSRRPPRPGLPAAPASPDSRVPRLWVHEAPGTAHTPALLPQPRGVMGGSSPGTHPGPAYGQSGLDGEVATRGSGVLSPVSSLMGRGSWMGLPPPPPALRSCGGKEQTASVWLLCASPAQSPACPVASQASPAQPSSVPAVPGTEPRPGAPCPAPNPQSPTHPALPGAGLPRHLHPRGPGERRVLEGEPCLPPIPARGLSKALPHRG